MTRPLRAFARILSVCAGCLAVVCGFSESDSPRGQHDPAFDLIPFKDWTSGSDSAAQLQWTFRVAPAQLSFHQRLVSAAIVQIDGAELARRRGKGQFVVFTQFTDAAGNSYQSHTSQDLTAMQEGVSASNVQYLVRAFVLPGEYRVTTLLLASASKEHWSKTEKVQIGGLRHDPLPEAWRNLPTVEYVPNADAPESWFLPGLPDRLNLSMTARNPERVDVLVNLTPSERHEGSTRFRNETLGALIPTLKVISAMRSNEASMNVALLDLSRRRVAFQKNNIQDVNWDAMKDAFADTATDTIDVHSLENRGKDAAFFVKEVNRAISTDPPAGTKHAVVILSASTSFESGEDLRPIEATPGSCPVFYIRYEVPVVRQLPPQERGWQSGRGGRRGGLGDPAGRRFPAEHVQAADQLEKTLKPVSPRLFDVNSPEQMRKALATIREEIERL